MGHPVYSDYTPIYSNLKYTQHLYSNSKFIKINVVAVERNITNEVCKKTNHMTQTKILNMRTKTEIEKIQNIFGLNDSLEFLLWYILIKNLFPTNGKSKKNMGYRIEIKNPQMKILPRN